MNFLVKIISNSYKNIQNLIKLYIYDINLIPTYYNNQYKYFNKKNTHTVKVHQPITNNIFIIIS